jgi:UDPglucose 6-dehydrogenase/GDP-mannose 6-dehydrogenase
MNVKSSVGAVTGLRITVVGTGYVGLVTGACLAHIGHHVTCVDRAVERVADVNRGVAPFYEPSLLGMISSCVREGRLRATTDTADAVATSDITFLAVGTPSNENGIDLSYLSAAAREIGSGLTRSSGYHVVVVKSTVVPGTTDMLVRGVIERASGLPAGSFGLCMNPEFLREGSAVADFMDPDRIVIGQWDKKSGSRLAEVYAGFNCPKLFVTLRNAEMTKYASNALLATLISFSNELAAMCEATPGADVAEVLNALHLDRRFSAHGSNRPGILTYLRAGCGYGGSCLPKDVAAIRHYAFGQGVTSKLLDAVAAVNETRPVQLVGLAKQALGNLRGCTIAVLGLAFKPGTDDLRDSPALTVIKLLKQEASVIRAYDPMISALPDIEGVTVCRSARDAVVGCDAAIIATAWPELAGCDWKQLCAVMRAPVVLDGRNALAADQLPASAIYIPIGKYFEPQGTAVGK